MKNKKGFTLIELLVTIVIMIMILGIAIISIRKLSEAKKEEAWKTVKKQVETAATQYFQSNEYFLKEQLSDGGCGFVSVGTLVNEDYLNIVTNPKTGTPLDNCEIVKVCKNGNNYIYSYKEEDEDVTGIFGAEDGYENGKCVMPEPLVYNNGKTNNENKDPEGETPTPPDENENSEGEVPTPSDESEAPTINFTAVIKNSSNNLTNSTDISELSNYNNNTWINKWVFVKVSVNFDSSGGSLKCTDSRKSGSDYPDFPANSSTRSTYRNINSEGTTKISCTATGSNGKKTVETVNIKLDHTAPSFSIVLKKKANSDALDDSSNISSLSNYSKNTWYNGYVFTKLTSIKDSLSGIESYTAKATGPTDNTVRNHKYRNVNSEGISVVYYEVCDKAGNCTNQNTGKIKLDRTLPTITIGDNYAANCKSFKYWDTNNVQYKNSVRIEDEVSGIKLTDYDYKYNGNWLNEDFGVDTKGKARANTAVLERTAEGKLKKIYQSYNFLVNKDSTFKIRTCDNANNCTSYVTKNYSAKSSSNFDDYCREKYPQNSTLNNRYLNECETSSSVYCWLEGDCDNTKSSCKKD